MEAFAHLLRQAYEAHKVKARERSTVNELRALDDRVLKDIGVSRSDITFIARKLGLVTGPGASFCGNLVLAGLGVPDQVYRSVAGTALLVNEDLQGLPARDANAYKQALGHLVVVGGDHAGRLSGFDTGGSDLVYLAADCAPYLLTVLVGVPLLVLAGRRRRPLLLGVGAVLGGAKSAMRASDDKSRVVKNCLRGRGYKVLN